jgi:hypothetical protein
MTTKRIDLAITEDRPGTKRVTRIGGVVLGLLIGTDSCGPLVDFPENPTRKPILARSLVPVETIDAGREIALTFVGSDPSAPLVLGFLHAPEEEKKEQLIEISADGESVRLTAQKEIVLKCGDASITLTRAGKVTIEGKYVVSRSTGANLIQGGSIQLN